MEECESRMRAAERKLQEETKTRKLVEQRFAQLAQNHEEMIRIKDGYKSSNSALAEESRRLRQEIETGSSAAVREKERLGAELRQELAACRRSEREAVNRCDGLERRVSLLSTEMNEERARSEREMLEMKTSLAGTVYTIYMIVDKQTTLRF